MPAPQPSQALKAAPLADLVVLLLKQFKRILDQQGLVLTVPEMEALGTSAENRQAHESVERLKGVLEQLIEESLGVLRAQFQLSFIESLATDMNSIGGWESTAEFLEIANIKANAELRISVGASLLAFFGDKRYADLLLAVIAYDAGAWDVDAMFAKRALSHLCQVDFDNPDWENLIKTHLAS